MLAMAGCGGSGNPPVSPMPTPVPTPGTANAYILPNAVAQAQWAFGDEPVVVYRGERLRWINADSLTHAVVAEAPDATDFCETQELRPGGEQSFTMNKLGTTNIHCPIHPVMTGTLIVRER
jgi:plastocyanin